MDDTWERVRGKLAETIGQSNFANWIEPLKLSELRDGIAVFDAPTGFFGSWVLRNFGELIVHHLNEAGEKVRKIEFSAPRCTGTAKAEPGSTDCAESRIGRQDGDARTDDLPGAPLDSRFTFDSFVVGKPNELAHAAARRVAENAPVTFNPLFLYGGVGLGKTHLMHAIAHELDARHPDLCVVYLSAEQFMHQFVRALRERKMMDFKDLFRSVDILMVDDVQFIAGKDSTQEEFFHTFNSLVDQQKQMVISADRAPGEIGDLEERIRSRLQSGLVVDLHPADYELRLGILQRKVDLYRARYPEAVIADGVLEFLAQRISTDVRALEGALIRLFAFAALVNREITPDLARDCLADMLRASDRKITIEEIQRRVSEHYNVRLSDMIGPRRQRAIARPRQIAMYLAKHLTSRSLPEIGRHFGRRDHTTVIHGVRRIEELRATDNRVAEDIELLRRALEA